MRERRETLSFLSFLPRGERPLLAGKPPYTSKTFVPESNKDRINCFITFRDQLSYFVKKGKIILCGNFNARTGNLDDFAEDVS